MANLFKQFETNEVKEKEGIPITFDANDDGTIPTFIVARTGGANQEWNKILDQELSPYRRLQEAGKLPEEVNRKIVMRTFIKASLKGWSNVYDKNDQPIEYSFDNALALFQALPNLFSILQVRANALSSYQDGLEGDAKN